MLKNKLIYLFIIVFTIVYTILYESHIMFVFATIVILLPVISFLLLVINYFAVDGVWNPPIGAAVKNKKIPVTFQLKNRFVLPVNNIYIELYYGSYMDKKKKVLNKTFSTRIYDHTEYIQVPLDSFGSVTTTCQIKSEYSGFIGIYISRIKIMDYFKIFTLTKTIKEEFKIAVLPELYLIENEIFINGVSDTQESNIYSKIKSGDDSSEVFDIRDYQEGDKLQRIHWKLSNKTDKLMVKEFSLPVRTSAIILVELEFNGKREDFIRYRSAIYETALSLSHSLIQSSYSHYVAWYDIKEEEYKRLHVLNEEDVYTVMEELIHMDFYKENGLVIDSQQALYEQEYYGYMAYIGGNLSSETGKNLNENRFSDVIQWIQIDSDGKPVQNERSIMKKESIQQEDLENYKITMAQVDSNNVEQSILRLELG